MPHALGGAWPVSLGYLVTKTGEARHMAVIDCERAVQEIGRDRPPAGTVLRRERSSCASMQ
jgi:hypothetical protein